MATRKSSGDPQAKELFSRFLDKRPRSGRQMRMTREAREYLGE